MESSDELARPVRDILRTAAARTSPRDDPVAVDARSLRAALVAASEAGQTPVIAEVKPTSPTTENVRDEDPVALARRMVDGGATALSVLTEPTAFGGSVESLRRIREAVDVPVLRKDFIVEEAQLDAVAADAVLLIVRFLDDLPRMVAAAHDRGFQPLVEVHTRAELREAVAAGADLVGVNNRDLATLSVDRSTFERVARDVPDGVTLVAESGVRSPADARRMRRAGADGLLVGTAIMDGVPESTDSSARGASSLDDVTENTRRLVNA